MTPAPAHTAAAPGLLRRINSALVLDLIRSHGPLSRADIARSSGLSKPTVNEVVELLVGAEFVEEVPEDGASRPGRPGRRARLLRFRAEAGYVLGLDIGADKCLALVADLSGRILAEERRPVDGRAGPAAVLRQVRAAANAVTHGVPDDSVLRAAGIATPGVVDPESGKIELAPQLEGWEGLDLGPRLQRSLDCPIVVDNETDMSLLAERWRGAARDVRHAVYVQVGIGIGGAILVNGELFRGKRGAAGEIGYLVSGDDPAGEPPAFGSGPFEWAAGGRAYARMGARAAARRSGRTLRELAGGDPNAVTAETVFAAAAAGDGAARAIVDELTGRLGRGVANMATVLDPELVILGGGVANAGPALLEPVARIVREHVPAPPRVVLSELGDESAALGAVRRALDVTDELLFSFA